MLDIDRQRASRGQDEPGADAGVFWPQFGRRCIAGRTRCCVGRDMKDCSAAAGGRCDRIQPGADHGPAVPERGAGETQAVPAPWPPAADTREDIELLAVVDTRTGPSAGRPHRSSCTGPTRVRRKEVRAIGTVVGSATVSVTEEPPLSGATRHFPANQRRC